MGVPVGFMTAVFLAKVAPPKLAAVVRPAVDLLAGIPSVVYGLVGMMVLVPAVRRAFDLPAGASLFCAIIVLAIMILPSIISVSETALKAVPPEYEEASLALGATHIETVFPGQRARGLAAASPRRWCWASAAPSARPWPSSWWPAMWPICPPSSPASGS